MQNRHLTLVIPGPRTDPEPTVPSSPIGALTWFGLLAATLVAPLARAVSDTLEIFESGARVE